MKVSLERSDLQVQLALGDILALLDLLAHLVKMETRAISDLLDCVVLKVTMVLWDLLVLKDLLVYKEHLVHPDLLENLEPLVFKVQPVVREVKVLVV